MADGEVSPYLGEVLAAGDPLELRGPVGGWFVWDPADPAPVLLVAGGSGIVPLMAMIRPGGGGEPARRSGWSTRSAVPPITLYRDELAERQADDVGLQVAFVYTREHPPGWLASAGRSAPRSSPRRAGQRTAPAAFVCGPTGFVEAVANVLVGAGHGHRIKTERFGPTGGQS